MSRGRASREQAETPSMSPEGRIGELCRGFEAAWQAGRCPRIADFFSSDATDESAETLRELLIGLVGVDLLWRWRAAAESLSGEAASQRSTISPPERLQLADYLAQYPQLGGPGEIPPQLIAQEYYARRRWGDRPEAAEYLALYGGSCPAIAEWLREADDRLAACDTGRQSGADVGTGGGMAAGGERGQSHFRSGDAGERAGGRGQSHFRSGENWDSPLGENWDSPRGENGDSPLRLRCPHCRAPFEVADARPIVEVVCPSCGSRFALAGGTGPAPAAAPCPKTIAHFELTELLGMGAFGSVWKARDTDLDCSRAIKLPRKGQLDAEETEKFLREARVAARLQHPHIVSVHEVGLEGDLVYIVSDFIAGQSLDKWLADQKPNYREAALLCATIADALHHAHESGVIHRDLKPSNIMIDARGQPHLMDFGLARREAGEVTMTVEGQILGTPAYMSPEQARGEGHAADRRCDVYSLGVILFELLTGERPFRGNVRMLLKQVMEDDAPGVRRLDSHIPRDLETICARCLEKDPRRRYATAADVAAELRRFLAGAPIRARPVSRPERFWRWCKREPALAGLSAAVAVALLAGSAVSTHFGLQAEDRARDAIRQTGIAVEKENVAVEKTRIAEQNEAEAKANLYFLRIAWANQRWLDNDAGQVEPILDKCDAGLREWEWHYLKRLCRLDLLTIAHAERLSSFALSPDGQSIVTCTRDSKVRLWNATTGEEGPRLRPRRGLGHLFPVTTATFLADGEQFATAAQLLLRYWDTASGQQLGEGVYVPGGLIAFSRDGTRIAALRGRTVKVWQRGSKEDPLTLPGAAAMALSADGQRLATASDENAVKVFDAESGEELFNLEGHAAAINSVEFNAEGTRIASASSDRTVKVWNATSGEEVFTLRGHAGPVSSAAFSADGRQITSGGEDRTVRLWEAETGKPRMTLRGHAAAVTGVKFGAGGTRVASASEDRTIKLWDATISRGALLLRADPERLNGLAFSPDGRYVATAGSDRTVKVWDAATGQLELTTGAHPMSLDSVAFAPDGKHLASGGRLGIKVWDATTQPPGERTFIGSGELVAFNTDGTRIATRSNTLVSILDAATGKVALELRGPSGSGHAAVVNGFAFGADGRHIASAGGDKVVKLWDAATGAELRTLRGHGEAVNGVAFQPGGDSGPKQAASATGRVASASDDRTVKVWDVATGQTVHTLRGHDGPVTSVAFSPNGARIVSGGRDAKVKLWDAAAGHDVLTLHDCPAPVTAVAFSGQRIAAACADGTLCLWDAAPLASIRAGDATVVEAACFGPDEVAIGER